MRYVVRALLVFAIAVAVTACAGTNKRNAAGDGASGDSAAEINTRLGLAYLQQGNAELALEKLNKALEQDPKSATAHHYLAETYRQTGQYEEAHDHFKKALALASKDGAIHNNYGVFLCEMREFAAADRAFLHATKLRNYASPSDAYENAGLCALREPDIKRAEERFRAALKLKAKRPVSLYQLAELSLTQKNYLEARAFLQRYEEVAPPSAHTLWLGVQIERELGNYGAAENYGKSLVQKFPNADETRLYRNFAESR